VDDGFQDGEQILAAYSESWALNYFLLNRHTRIAYVRYLQNLAEKPPLVEDSAEQRLAEFEEAFGDSVGLKRSSFVSCSGFDRGELSTFLGK
jgi:hypothetical protein